MSPPRARLALRVGVVGHRPNRLPDDEATLAALRARIAQVLRAARDEVARFQAEDGDAALYAPDPPLLRAVSALAEGTDRTFAEEALALGYALTCPMPFPREEFERDFTGKSALEPDSRERFGDLLAKAEAGAGLVVFELDGRRDDLGAAYGAAGRVVLNQSDLLVVVWDGQQKAGPGGTVDTVQEAIRFHVPVLWIDARDPARWSLVRDVDDLQRIGAARTPAQSGSLAAAVARIVRQELALPPINTAVERAHAKDFFAERRPSLNVAFVWKLFRNLVGETRLAMPALLTRDFDGEIRSVWPAAAEEGAVAFAARGPDQPPPAAYRVNADLRAHYAWADKLADLKADAYRSAFILGYLLSAAAVFVALLPLAMGWTHEPAAETLCIEAEFVIVLAILALLIWGRGRRWHERWMEYRLLAELTRQLKLLIPLGGGRPLPRTPVHLAGHGDPAQTWMTWRLRAIARCVGAPSARVTPAYVDDCLVDLADIAGRGQNGQEGFHHANAERAERINHRLHGATVGLFTLTVLGICLHLAPYLLGERLGQAGAWIEHGGNWLVMASAVFPALGAALAGINNHGDFARMAKRSSAMADAFAQFSRRIAASRAKLARGEAVPLAEVIPLASTIAQTMVDEVIDWRVVVLDRPQTA